MSVWFKELLTSDSFVYLSTDHWLHLYNCLMSTAGCVRLFFFMAALHGRCGHYVFAVWFLSSIFYLSFFPCLITAVAEWMSAILRHMVWL